jgi:hypothetical protein
VSTSRPIASRPADRVRVGQGPADRSTGRFRLRRLTSRGERGLHEEGTKREEAKGAELIGSVLSIGKAAFASIASETLLLFVAE